MEKELKIKVQSELPNLEHEINELLKSKGFSNLRLKNLRLEENDECRNYKWVCNKKTGVCYKVCLD